MAPRLFLALVMAFSVIPFSVNAAPAPANLDESKVPPYTLPDPLVCIDGTPVRDSAAWQNKRRPELLAAT